MILIVSFKRKIVIYHFKKDVKLNVNTISEFGRICDLIKQTLFNSKYPNFIAGKFENPPSYKDNYMWISTSDEEVGFAQCHYEIRLSEDLSLPVDQKEFISVEIHIESSKKSISNELNSALNGLVLSKTCQGTNYIWKSTSKKFPVNINQVPSIINELHNIDNIVGYSLRKKIKEVLG